MAKGRSQKEINDTLKAQRDLANQLYEIRKAEAEEMSSVLNMSKQQYLNELDRERALSNIKSVEEALNDAKKNGVSLSKEFLKDLEKNRKKELQNLDISKKALEIQKKRVNVLKSMASYYDRIASNSLWTFLMQSDQAIRNVSRELGVSGQRAEELRQNLQNTADDAARLGGNIQDLANIMSTFADETGRATMLTEQALKNVMEIGLGTGLGVDQAARLAGQFELMGLNAESTADYVQGVVDTTERMGVNTTKVLKNITQNFKELQKFTFRQGVQGFAEMAAYSEKFKVDMGSMLDSAERARTLEGAVELAAQLQVMGGEFAKSDPFEMLFLSRNDPEKFTKKINQMTKGVASLRKMSDGTFQTFISPMDIDRLDRVGEALGMQKGELAEQARRMAEIQKTRQQMLGLGFGAKEKDLVEGAARLNTQTGRMQVNIGGIAKDVSSLTKDQIKQLETQQRTLEQRAEDAKTFDKVFQDTIMELKAGLLPILNGINDVLKNNINPTINTIRDIFKDSPEWVNALLKGGGMFLAAGMAIGGASKLILGSLSTFTSILPKLGKFGLGGLMGGKSGGSIAGKATGSMGKGGSMKALGVGAGAGLAAAGVGGGIKLAADGFTNLAKAISDMPVDKLETFESITERLSIVIPATAGGIALLAAVAAPAAGPLLAFGGAVALVGAGIGIASAGIGYMAEGMSSLMETANPTDIMATAAGMTALAGASVMFANPLSMVGLGAMTASVLAMSKAGGGMEQVGNAFEQINVVLQGSTSQLKQVEETIKAISSAEVGNNSAIASIGQLLNKPLKVEFSDKEVALNVDVSLNIDSQVVAKKLNLSRRVSVENSDQKDGKSGGGGIRY